MNSVDFLCQISDVLLIFDNFFLELLVFFCKKCVDIDLCTKIAGDLLYREPAFRFHRT
jgi:hypothetical protein